MRSRTILAAALVLTAQIAQAQTRSSIWDGVYTDVQAEQGRTLYMQNCSRCHGADLSGNYETPPLVGRFMPYWSGSTLDVLLDYVSAAMPLDHPGALSAEANTDILAFILKGNGIPAGTKELSPSRIKAIHFDPSKPISRHTAK